MPKLCFLQKWRGIQPGDVPDKIFPIVQSRRLVRNGIAEVAKDKPVKKKEVKPKTEKTEKTKTEEGIK